MNDGPRQAFKAVGQQVGYVTILLGGNDVCTSSPGTMTSVATFRSQFRRTLHILKSGLPRKVACSWPASPTSTVCGRCSGIYDAARQVWDLAHICQSLLSPSRTEEERQVVRQRNIDFNSVLAEECAGFARCRFDDLAVFNHAFAREDVSRLDYFHPSLAGQADLAAVTWAHSWWTG